MEELPRGGVIVFENRQRARCQELWAVLNAGDIAADVVRRGRVYLLVVPEEDLPRAVAELEDYRRENLPGQPEPQLVPRSGGRLGVLAYAVTLFAVAGLADRRAFSADWFEAGRAQAGMMVDGQWWRAVTALTLHLGARHLLGNVVFGSVFGYLAAQRLGGGAAWLAIVLGGAVGNAANALLQNPSHSAVGASTAVFAALGLMVALALVHRRGSHAGPARRWSPLVAGILLLAWMGMGGDRTDVLAHVTGLLAGLGLGMLGALVPLSVLDSRTVQAGAAVLALAIVALAWVVALR